MFSKIARSATVAAFAFVSAYAAAGPSQVPFKASVAIVDTIGVPGKTCASNQSFGSSVGTGNASHLGRITFVAKDCVSIVGFANIPGSTTPLPIFHFQGQPDSLVITAANGDMILGTYSGTLYPTGGPDANGFAPYTVRDGTFTIDHGTGRFTNIVATSGVLTGNETLNLNPQNPAPSTGTFQLDGKISY